MPRTEALAGASPRASSAVLPDPHLTRGASSNGSIVPAQPRLMVHEMKQCFHKTPYTNLSLEISTKIHSFQDPKGHLASSSLVIWYNSVQKTSPNNFCISSIISTRAISCVKGKAFQRQGVQLGPSALRGATGVQNIIDCKVFFTVRTTSGPPASAQHADQSCLQQ